MTLRSTMLMAAVAVLVLASAAPAVAGPGDVFYAGELLWTFRASAGGASPEARAHAVHVRLVEAISAVHSAKAEGKSLSSLSCCAGCTKCGVQAACPMCSAGAACAKCAQKAPACAMCSPGAACAKCAQKASACGMCAPGLCPLIGVRQPAGVGCAFVVCVAGTPIVTVTKADGEANAICPGKLAGIWAEKLCHAVQAATRD